MASLYEGALSRLGAQQSEAAGAGSGRVYDNTDDNGRSIQIAVVDATGRRSIAIIR